MQPILTIAIPTVNGRERQFESLTALINQQIAEHTLMGIVEVISKKDNKEISIGKKRDELYKIANGKYTVQIDDDDSVSINYITTVLQACQTEPDCIGYIEHCTIQGKHEGNSIITKNYPDWVEKITPCEENHFCVRARTPFFKVPIKTEICRTVGVADLRWSEDHDFARRILPHLKTEIFIAEPMYYYRHNSEPGGSKVRYGIK